MDTIAAAQTTPSATSPRLDFPRIYHLDSRVSFDAGACTLISDDGIIPLTEREACLLNVLVCSPRRYHSPRTLAQALERPGGNPSRIHENILNGAVTAPRAGRPFEYIIYAGARRATPQQGLLVVIRLDQDPCAPGAPGTHIREYVTPFQAGAVTITQLNGDTVTFASSSGAVGQFNYISGQFS